MSEERIRNICEQAISYLYDNDLLADFLYDRSVEFGAEEKSYFELPDWDEEED